MLSTNDCRDALVATLQASGHYKEVQPITLERLVDAGFFKTFPALRLPAALICWKGRDDTSQGSGKYRDTHWSLISCTKDVNGNGLTSNLTIVDALAETGDDRFFDRQILDDELTILGTHRIAIAIAHESLCVLEIAFETREASERE